MKLASWLSLSAALVAQSVVAATYTIDASHTYPVFEIDHLGFSVQRGQFDETSGIVELDEMAQTGRIDVSINVASLDSGHTQRDEILKGAEWLDATRHPHMTYRSSRLIFGQGRLTQVEGDLTLRGVTRPVRLDIVRYKCGLNLAARKRGCGADAVAVLRRSEFGMTKGLPFVGDEVRLLIQLEAYQE